MPKDVSVNPHKARQLHRQVAAAELPLEQRQKILMDCGDELAYWQRKLEEDVAEPANVLALRKQNADDAARTMELEQELAKAREHQHASQQSLAVAIITMQKQQQALADELSQLAGVLEAAKAELDSQHAATFSTPTSRLNLDQAYTLCCAITKVELPFKVFKEHNLLGAMAVQVDALDWQQLCQLEPLGVRHRLVHCLKQTAHEADPTLLRADFEAEVARLNVWLKEQDGLAAEDVQAIADAKIDILTCASLESSHLATLGIGLGARKALLQLLRQATASLQPIVENRGGSAAWTPDVQRAVLEAVLQDNSTLAARLQAQAQQVQDVPDEYQCPITQELMADPVMAEDGYTYEREAIATWVAGNGTSPVTRERISARFLPNRVAKAGIQRWQAAQ